MYVQFPSAAESQHVAGLKEINEDCVAWIYIEDTAINYPVVQGSDNSFYLKHLIDGKWNSAGCIFLDFRVDSNISDRHSIIYGHHMKDGTMFSGLTKYKKQDYYEAHPEGLLINGASANIAIPYTRENCIVVPQEATFEIQNKIYAYKVVDGKATSVMISVFGINNGKEYIVESGLSEGDTIVATGAGLLREGTYVVAAGSQQGNAASDADAKEGE